MKSSATQTRPDLLLRVMRGLQGLGLVMESGGRISATETGALLGSDAAGSLRDVALHAGAEAYKAWGELEHAVRTGEPAFEVAFGESFFSYLRSHPDAGASFDGICRSFRGGSSLRQSPPTTSLPCPRF